MLLGWFDRRHDAPRAYILGVKARARAVVIVLIVGLSSGCAAGGYNADSLRDRLVKAGLRPTQASCVINAMVRKFGADQLNARTAPIAAELRTERTLLRTCKVAINNP
jgi:hypothetical protein